MTHLIELKDVYKIYPMGDETVHALDGVSLSIDQGEFVAIVGSSGSGLKNYNSITSFSPMLRNRPNSTDALVRFLSSSWSA